MAVNIFVKLEYNKLFFRNEKTKDEYEIATENPISQNGLLIANIDNAIEYIKMGISHVMPKYGFLKPKIYLMPMKNLNEISEVEQQAILDAIYKAGAGWLYIIDKECDVGKDLEINKFGTTKKIENKIKIFNFEFKKEIIRLLIMLIIGIIGVLFMRIIRMGLI